MKLLLDFSRVERFRSIILLNILINVLIWEAFIGHLWPLEPVEMLMEALELSSRSDVGLNEWSSLKRRFKIHPPLCWEFQKAKANKKRETTCSLLNVHELLSRQALPPITKHHVYYRTSCCFVCPHSHFQLSLDWISSVSHELGLLTCLCCNAVLSLSVSRPRWVRCLWDTEVSSSLQIEHMSIDP